MMMSTVFKSRRRVLTVMFCRFLVYITSTLYVKSFRIQSLRPFTVRNVNSMKSDMTNGYYQKEEVFNPITIQPDNVQRDAILCKDPAILIVAGPGSGKTRVMAARLAYLLISGTCSATECLVISFTSSAATNLLEKTKDICNGSVASTVGVFCDTFHGFCNTVLKDNLHLLMEPKGFYIASDEDQARIMTDLMECNRMPASRAEVKNILNTIRYWKELGLGYLGIRKNSLQSETEKNAYRLFPLYQSKLKSMSALDFGDLLLSTLRIFREHPEVLDQYRKRFRHILVDEFQDVSRAQYDILRMLVMGPTVGRTDMAWQGSGGLTAEEAVKSSSSRSLAETRHIPRTVNVFCAGDDDQSIYGHRGARVEIMQRFRFDFPGSRILKFGISYRLPDAICRATQSFISNSVGRIPKPLVSGHQLNVEGNNMMKYGEEGNILDLEVLQKDSSGTFPGMNFGPSKASIQIRSMQNEEEEIEWTVAYLKHKVEQSSRNSKESSQNVPNGMQQHSNAEHSVAILTRFQADLHRLEDLLKRNNIAYSSRNFGFWQQAEYASPLTLLRLIAYPDDDVAFQAALDNDILSSVHPVEVESVIMTIIKEISTKKGSSLLEAARECVLRRKFILTHEIVMTNFLRKIEEWSNQVKFYRKGDVAEKIVLDILKSAFSSRWSKLHVAAARLSSSAAGYDSLQHFITAIRLEGVFVEDYGVVQKDNEGDLQRSGTSSSLNFKPLREEKQSSPKVTIWLMAMHAAKGLEFDEVILPFWSKGTNMDIDEIAERKIAFMSLTRAKQRVLISYSQTKRLNKMHSVPTGASLFVEALMDTPGLRTEHVDRMETSQGLGQREGGQLTLTTNRQQQQQQQQQQAIYGSSNLDSYSSSTTSSTNRDTYSILNNKDKDSSTNIRPTTISTSPSSSSSSSSANNSLRTMDSTKSSSIRAPALSAPPMERSSMRAFRLNEENHSFPTPVDDAPSPEVFKVKEKGWEGERGTMKEKSGRANGRPLHPLLNKDLVALVNSKAPRIAANKLFIDAYGSAQSYEGLLAEQTCKTVQKKSAKAIQMADFEKANGSAGEVNIKKVDELLKSLSDRTIGKGELALFFRKVLGDHYKMARGSITVGGEKKKALSSCTPDELGEYLKVQIIKKHGLDEK